MSRLNRALGKWIPLLWTIALFMPLDSFSQSTSLPRRTSNDSLQALLSSTNQETSCGADHFNRHPEFESQRILNEQLMQAAEQRRARILSNASVSETVYTIPVVFHVVHLGEPVGVGSNISDAQIESAVVALNHHFRKVPGSTGDGAGVDTNIQFVLAKRDPSGNPHNGIVRVNGSSVANYSTLGIEGSAGNGASEEAVKALSTWPRAQYMNVWVVTEIEGNNGGSGIQGYAYFPVNSSVDGIVVLNSATGTLGTAKSYTNQGKVLSHEAGHYLNLYHTFNSTAACGVETSCETQGDRVCDTPPTPQGGSCSNPGCSGTQQVQNYMDYTSQTCQNLFTTGQKTRMRLALETLRTSILSSLGGTAVTALDAAITPSGVPSFICNTNFQPKATLTNVGSTTITSATVRYRVDGGAWESINYSGSLASGSSTILTLPGLPTLAPGSHTLEFNVNAPNGGVDETSSNNSATTTITVPTNPETINVSFTLDFYGSENTYSGALGGENVFSGGPFSGAQGTVVNNYHCLAPGCYTVTIRDQYGDGQSFTTGSYRIVNGAGTVLFTNSGNWGAIQTHNVCVGGASGGGGSGGGGSTPTPTPTPTPVVDSTPPTVALTAPVSGTILNSTVDSRINLAATASDNVGVTRVEFYRGTTLIGSDVSSPYTLSYNTAALADGSYQLKAKALDLAGNSTFSSIVTVVIDRTLPTGSISSPAHLSSISGTSVNLLAAASDAVGIERVDFYRNGVLLGSATTAPYQYPWNISALSNGLHTIGIRIYDTAGNVFIPSSVNLIKGTNSDLTGAVTTSYGGASVGCYSRSQIMSFMTTFGCTTSCNTSFDTNGDLKIDHVDLVEVLGSMCHE